MIDDGWQKHQMTFAIDNEEEEQPSDAKKRPTAYAC